MRQSPSEQGQGQSHHTSTLEVADSASDLQFCRSLGACEQPLRQHEGNEGRFGWRVGRLLGFDRRYSLMFHGPSPIVPEWVTGSWPESVSAPARRLSVQANDHGPGSALVHCTIRVELEDLAIRGAARPPCLSLRIPGSNAQRNTGGPAGQVAPRARQLTS
jgi:hypothetical protein